MRGTSDRTRLPLLLLVVSIALAGVSSGQVSSSQLSIGGVGAFGCLQPAQSPPVLANGAIGTGECMFSYNQLTQVLTLTVSNTSPVVPNEQNPVIRRVYVNLPALAVANAVLISQTGSGGPAPTWTLAIDTDITNNTGSIDVGCFGHFGLRLSDQGGIEGCIANPAAPLNPSWAGSMVIGPVTFEIQIIGSSLAASSLIASSFSSSLAYNPGSSDYVNAAFRFQPGSSGGTDVTDDSDENVISSRPVADGGSPAGWIVGTPAAGQNVTLVMAGTPGWEACMVASLDPGPIVIAGITFPIGPDWVPLLTTQIPGVGFVLANVLIPTGGAELGGLTVYGLVVAASSNIRTISVSEQFSVLIDF
jgi:hypothetical protein